MHLNYTSCSASIYHADLCAAGRAMVTAKVEMAKAEMVHLAKAEMVHLAKAEMVRLAKEGMAKDLLERLRVRNKGPQGSGAKVGFGCLSTQEHSLLRLRILFLSHHRLDNDGPELLLPVLPRRTWVDQSFVFLSELEVAKNCRRFLLKRLR